MGESYTFPLKVNSVILSGTDGIFDNLFDDMLLSHVKNHISPIKKYFPNELEVVLDRLVDSIVDDAYIKSRNTSYFSPFQSDCHKNHTEWSGGKPDDMTLVVGMVI